MDFEILGTNKSKFHAPPKKDEQIRTYELLDAMINRSAEIG